MRRFLDYNAYQRRSEMIERERQNKAATAIQRFWRGHLVRDELRFEVHFATVIQAHVRGWLSRRRCVAAVAAKKEERKAEKGKLETRVKPVRERSERKAAMVTQEYSRGYLALKVDYEKVTPIEAQG